MFWLTLQTFYSDTNIHWRNCHINICHVRLSPKSSHVFFVINFLSKQPSAPAEQVFKRLNSFSCFSTQHQILEKSFTRSIFLFFVFLSKICFCKRHLFVYLFLLCHDVRQNITTCVSFQLSSLSLVKQFYFFQTWWLLKFCQWKYENWIMKCFSIPFNLLCFALRLTHLKKFG